MGKYSVFKVHHLISNNSTKVSITINEFSKQNQYKDSLRWTELDSVLVRLDEDSGVISGFCVSGEELFGCILFTFLK